MADEEKDSVEDYSPLKDFRAEIEVQEGAFSLCFWLYLMSSTAFPARLIQVQSGATEGAPFLVLSEKKKMVLLPLEVPHVAMETEFPMEKWIHIGCEVSSDFVLLHIDGEIAGKKAMSSLFNKDSISNGLTKITLDPPLQLSIDNSSASEIEEGGDGVWSIVGGKASCRRIFSLDVVLLDAFSHPINKELEVIAFLVYADNGAPVEKTSDGEAPLLASQDGVEFASADRPSKMLHGHASFKLKISQLSSKCDNRMFRIMFHMPELEMYPFLKAFSPPIRCISRNRSTRISSRLWKRPASANDQLNLSQLSGLDDETLELQHSSIHEEKTSPSSKRCRLGQDDECNSHSRTANQVKNVVRRSDSLEELDDSQTDSESPEARNSALKSTSSSRNPMSDATIFKYCLAGLTEKTLLLKEISSTASNEELLSFSHQVSLYSGCSHHRHQIAMAKRLIEEGNKAWNLISQNKQQVPWESVVFEIEEQFMKIASCNSRALTQQDFELLRRIAGCQEYLAQENFEKMWCWLYPVALTLSKDWINTMWSSTSPKWIEGFITKEEAETSLQGSRGLQESGTFVLRFPTSRSWPHPDAGSLVVTYVGSKHTIHNKIISLDQMFSSAEREKNAKPLQDMLLAEPELSRLGRIIRSR
ncbi:uncharacterized protein Pyn_30077 [Prunus yedoensis var. nudiflora]|uniref:SH2 domain-containing protein n=1 Tax=Prunus yedoensis var. nudiflora TaxID=2094558 RepID=A0A314ZJ98_PRUYE|nr:uncharacterized protein Pyn_30077 [Prunus yedoensis var. nudiflora]